MRRILFAAAYFTALTLPAIAEKAGSGSLIDKSPHLTVSGTASIEVPPDLAYIRLAVTTERKTAMEAVDENTRKAEVVVDEVRKLGVEPRDIETTSVSLVPVYEDEQSYWTGRIVKRLVRGYTARNELLVTVRDLGKAGRIARNLIDSGANEFEGISFALKDDEARTDALRAQAAQAALRRAQAYTEALGLKLGRALAIVPDGVSASAERPRQRIASTAELLKKAALERPPIPVEPGEITLSTSVRVTWEIAQ